jgi:hypothetical protein
VASNAGILGFQVYAGGHAVTSHPIAVHAGRSYHLRTAWQHGPYTLHILLRNGMMQVQPLR